MLTAILAIAWCLLVNEIKLGTIVFGVILGLLIPIATAAYWPDRRSRNRSSFWAI